MLVLGIVMKKERERESALRAAIKNMVYTQFTFEPFYTYKVLHNSLHGINTGIE